MNDLFTPVTTMDGSVYLRSVGTSSGSGTVNFLMPISSFTNAQGQSVLPAGFSDKSSLYLTMNGTIQISPIAGSLVQQFTSLNVTLWADPNSNDGTPSVDFNNNPSFSNGQNNDIALATGSLVSGVNFLDGTTRHAILVETLNPTLDGTILLGGSIKPGDQIQEYTTTPGDTFKTQSPNAEGGTTGTITDGSVQITVSTPNPSDPSNPTPDTILLPNVPDLTHNVLGFIHHAKAIG